MNATDDNNPPRWADPILRILLGARWESISGDLLEEYRQTVLPALGPAASRRWYARQLLSYVSPLHLGILGGAVSAVAIILTNILIPALGVNLAPVAQAEAALNTICFGGLLLFWVGTGYLAHSRKRSLSASLRGGATTAFVHIALIMFTFFIINNLFLDIVSRQPDKIWDFQHSHASSMRAYINLAALRGLSVVLPVAVGIGAACGALGGLLDSLRHRRAATH